MIAKAFRRSGMGGIIPVDVMTSHTDSPLIIAIDGPSGAGKGTVARAVASQLGYRHVDTGAMYRALAWKAVYEKLDLEDEAALSRAGGACASSMSSDGVVRVDGHDVKSAIRTPEIDRAAAAVARQPGVREVLIRQQREMGVRGGVVMEGRDIGTVVFPVGRRQDLHGCVAGRAGAAARHRSVARVGQRGRASRRSPQRSPSAIAAIRRARPRRSRWQRSRSDRHDRRADRRRLSSGCWRLAESGSWGLGGRGKGQTSAVRGEGLGVRRVKG